MTWLLSSTAVASAVMGGIFFGFSSFIMPALGRIAREEGIHAMQRINIDVYHWSFMGTFFAIPFVSLGLGAYAVYRWGEPWAAYALVGSAVYLVGTFVVTAAGNVPLNEALAVVEPNTKQAAATWSRYLVEWSRWNHVRTAACIVAAGFFFAAARAS
ncbi:MAG: anthrone oxygenase family protein [Myxococcota bacterium]